MSKVRSHYDNLKISRNAPRSVIKAAYKALCQTYHPDKYPGGAEEAERIMKIINAAYAVLSDPEARAEHDAWLAANASDTDDDVIDSGFASVWQPKKAAASDKPRYWREAEKTNNAKSGNYQASADNDAFKDNAPPGAIAQYQKFAGWLLLLGVGLALTNLFTSPGEPGRASTSYAHQNSSPDKLQDAPPSAADNPVDSASLSPATAAASAASARPDSGAITAQNDNAKPIAPAKTMPADVLKFKQWAEQGNAYAQYELGQRYFRQQDYEQAVFWYRKAAEQDYAAAQNSLGTMYSTGHGVAQNYRRALDWYRKAAEQEYPEAQYNLGMMYARHQGITQDHNKAVYWWRKAAQQGSADAAQALNQPHGQLAYYSDANIPKSMSPKCAIKPVMSDEELANCKKISPGKTDN